MRDQSKITSDVTVYGATGFVGKYICEYLLASAKANDQPMKLVLGGRNKSKLQASMEALHVGKSTVEVFVAEGSDIARLTKMAESTKVVIACAGPFEKYGTNVVAACAETGADYVDITGEFIWVAKMRQQFGEAAKKSGARIISLCGFDSIPSDISILGAVEALRAARGGTEVEVESGKSWNCGTGGANAGTIHSALGIQVDIRHMLLDSKKSLRKPPYFLEDPLCMSHPTLVRHNPDYDKRKKAIAMSEWWNQLPSFDGVLGGGLSLAFCMAPINVKVVQSSATALKYGPDFIFQDRWAPLGFRFTRALGFFSAIPIMIFQWAFLITICVLKFPVLGQKLVDTFYPPGSGPPRAFNEICYTEIYSEVTAKAAAPTRDGSVDRAACHIHFEGDAGNLVTAQCVSESALALLYNRSELPKKSDDGFGTPAELLGMVLLKRLKENKVRKVLLETAVEKDAPKLNLKLLV